MVAVTLYVEGGRNGKKLRTACREGFAKLLERAGLKGTMPRIVACGSREDAFGDFETAVLAATANAVPVLLVDSEGPVVGDSPWAHVKVRVADGWERPVGASEQQLHLMVECMEAWLVADRANLSTYFGQGFADKALPAKTAKLERLRKEDLYRALAAATRQAKSKGEYGRGKHSFELLGGVDPVKLRAASSWAERFFAALEALLKPQEAP
jgi:hypothetical protein